MKLLKNLIRIFLLLLVAGFLFMFFANHSIVTGNDFLISYYPSKLLKVQTTIVS
ncbi:hypothetical protein [Epilithonimonas hominis]|uniref:hypothetical protein n=1 Tax=Epilithonimonas hominis TaxID=420404 RepID=UPI00289EE918|nr:hypothetical protein [Epilithonimonas hominis]